MTVFIAPSLMRNLKILTSALTAVALVLTGYRILYRYAMRKLWWEDACAILTLMGSVICVATSWLHFGLAGQPSAVSFWIHALAYPIVIWSVRLSILLSILRITSPSRNLRQVMILIAGLFVLMWLSLMITFVERYSGHHFDILPSQQDGKGTRALAIFELINILSDSPLVCLPIHSLRSIKLRRSQRWLIISAFSSSIFVTVVSLFRAVSQLLAIASFITVAIDVEVACSLFVCNSLFLTTLIYRVLHRNDDLSDANTNFPPSHPPGTRNNTLQLTTIDLDAFISTASSSIPTHDPTMT